MKQRQITLALVATALTLTLLTSCSTLGGLGGILGGSNPNAYPGTSSQTSYVQGTVSRVDTGNQRIDLTLNNSRQSSQNATIYYNSQTRVSYQNQTYNPSYLQRGDQVDVQLYNSGNGQDVANTITVVQRSANNGYPNNGYPNNTYPNNGSPSSDIRGTVTLVDTQAQRIDLNVNYSNGNGLRNSQSSSSIYYDSNTRVLYQNKSYAPTDLERGDQIDVLAYNNGNGRYLADTVTVTRNVRQ
jgi:transcriptional accessory protein Tex/SPT6